MSDDLAARPRIDTTINLGTLITAGVLFGTILIGWTVTREKVRENSEETARLSQQLDATLAEMGRLGNRMLTVENAMSYRADTVEAMNSKLDRLIELRTNPPGDRDGR